jgi:hypothetical protein
MESFSYGMVEAGWGPATGPFSWDDGHFEGIVRSVDVTQGRLRHGP